jgi:cell division septal protein FtsQ
MPEYNPKKRREPPPRSASRTAPRNAPRTAPTPPLQAKAATGARKNKKRGKQNMAIYYVMFLLITVIVSSVLSVTVLFNLEEIIVEGDSIYTDEQIIEASGIKPGVNLNRLNTEGNRQQLIDNLFYIDSVTIRKNRPSRLTIQVSGAVEMAHIEHEGSYYIVSENGRILAKAEIISGNTIIYGYEADEPEVGKYLRSSNERKNNMIYDIMNTIGEGGLKGIISVDITDHLDIRMNYMNRVELLVGPETDLEVKLKGAAELIENQIDINETGSIRLMDVPMLVFKRDVIEPAHTPAGDTGIATVDE